MLHTKEFRDLALQEPALHAMIFTAKLLAFTAYEVLTSPELLSKIKAEFASKENNMPHDTKDQPHETDYCSVDKRSRAVQAKQNGNTENQVG